MTKKMLKCHDCKTDIRAGEFMAILGEYPMKEYVGNTNAILRKWIETTNSKVYCYHCFEILKQSKD